MKKSTEELLELLKGKSHFNEFLKEEPEFIEAGQSDYLNQLLIEKGISKSEAIKRSGLDRTYAYQIFSGGRRPTRDKLIALGIGLNVTVDEMQKMLKALGFAILYVKNKRDSIILFCVDKNVDLAETNELLYEMGEPILE